MHIYSSMSRITDRMASVGSTYAAANGPGPLTTGSASSAAGGRQTGSDVETARHAALSALRNDRFGTMLEKISDPGSSGNLALMGQGATGSDVRSALSSYAENSD